MRKKFALAAASAILMTASAAGTASAQAAVGERSDAPAVIYPIAASSESLATVWDNCIHTQACLFSDTNGGGQIWVVPSSGRWRLANYGMDSRTSSFWNRSGGTLSLYEGDNYLMGSAPYGPPVNVPWGINDKATFVNLF